MEYKYDNSGNILKVTIIDINSNKILGTNTYEYTNTNWSDQLTKYNNESITYDEIGNPTTIGNKTLTWINGRSLNTYKDSTNNLDIQYKYNENGIRKSKIVNGKKIKYYQEGTRLIYEQRGNNIVYYLYDLTGLTGLEYNGNTYYYIKNIQDDIIGILNSNYESIVTYEYDSWGKILSIKDNKGNEITEENNIGLINPFRYRSYYYDVETELYYLNSRYYSPIWKRFINADEILGANKDILGYNLYIYVSNNPVYNYDDNGTKKKKAKNKKKLSSTKVSLGLGVVMPSIITKTISSNSVLTAKGGGGSSGPNKLPTTNKPNSMLENAKGDKRYYGPDGKVTKDVDVSHPEHHPELDNPHEHDWVWDEDGKSYRGKAHNFSETAINITVTLSLSYFIYRGIRILPSLIPSFWWTIPFNISTP